MTPVTVTCPNGHENSAPAFLWRMRVPAGRPDPEHYPSAAAEVKMQVTGC